MTVKESIVAQLVLDPPHNVPSIDGVANRWANEKKLLVKELEELKTDYQRWVFLNSINLYIA